MTDATPSASLTSHIDTVTREILAGRVVPFLGAGANLCGRPEQEQRWGAGSEYLPSGTELADYIAATFGYPEPHPADLIRVSQYASVMIGAGALYSELHSIFDVDYEPTALHRFLSTLPGMLRARGSRHPCQVIVTTNYDDSLERAFQQVDEPFDLIWYVADKPKQHRGRFMHRPPHEEPRPIETPNTYAGLSLDERTVILKMHGAIDRTTVDWDWDSYVITEDHYISYLTRTDIANLLPKTLMARLLKSHFLFLGHSLRDWNLRVILHRIWEDRALPDRSWAIQVHPDEVEERIWRERQVDIIDVPCDQYVEALIGRLANREPDGGG